MPTNAGITRLVRGAGVPVHRALLSIAVFGIALVGLVGRSCHGLPRLSTEDYVTLSPIYPTLTKPGYGPALGPSRAATLAGRVPWLALGGVHSPQRAAACAAAGAAGLS